MRDFLVKRDQRMCLKEDIIEINMKEKKEEKKDKMCIKELKEKVGIARKDKEMEEQ